MKPSARLEASALKTSMIVAFCLAIWGIIMAWYTRSGAIMLDGMFNLISSIMTFFSIQVTHLIRRPGNKRYPLGYYAYETLFVLIKGASILVLVIMAVTSSIQVMLAGGREPKLGLMTVYVVFAVLGALIVYIKARRSYSDVKTDVLHAEMQAWMLNAIISGAIGVAFGIGILIADTSFGWINHYLDQILVIVFSLVFIKDPVLLFRNGLRELLLSAPADELREPFVRKLDMLKEIDEIKAYSVEVMKTGRRMWVTVRAEPADPMINFDDLMLFKKELQAAVCEVHENTEAEIIVDRIT